MRLENGTVSVSDRPGFGIELDEKKLELYRADI
jgi:L-alanine-DL-glutamate epimerase-like enolase superfamily enzyme